MYQATTRIRRIRMATTIAWFVYRRPPGERGWGFPSMVVARKYIEFVKKVPGVLVDHCLISKRLNNLFDHNAKPGAVAIAFFTFSMKM